MGAPLKLRLGGIHPKKVIAMNVRDLQKRARDTNGQSLIEFALSLPIIFLLIVNLVNFGGFFYAWITVANAARAGVNYAILGGASAGFPSTPSAAKVQSIITQDASALPNSGSLSVNICRRDTAATPQVTALAGTCTSIPADPESSSYILTTVDVTYTYQPFIPVFSFPRLGVYLTIPPTTIYQRADMRWII